jgi:hypothetical protein
MKKSSSKGLVNDIEQDGWIKACRTYEKKSFCDCAEGFSYVDASFYCLIKRIVLVFSPVDK